MSSSRKTVLASQIIKDRKLTIAYKPEGVDAVIDCMDINRPGLQLAGFFDNFQYNRVQIMGRTEYLFFKSLSKEKRKETIDKLMSFDIPLLILSNNQKVLPEMLESAKKHSRILVKSKESSTKTVSKISFYLNEHLAPEVTMHGVLVDVDGVGILITGESGVGKSETALELVRKNHRLIADDAVKVIKLDEDTLQGRPEDGIKNFMEIRGLGIIDIKALYGVGAIKNSKKIDMVIELETWKADKYYDRLGLDQEYTRILGNKIEKLTLPVRPGRNLSIIIELAARNHRQKSMGYNSATSFNKKLKASLKKNRKKQEIMNKNKEKDKSEN